MREELTLTDVAKGEAVKDVVRLSMVMWDIPATLNGALESLEQHNVWNATVVIPTNYRIVHKSKVEG